MQIPGGIVEPPASADEAEPSGEFRGSTPMSLAN